MSLEDDDVLSITVEQTLLSEDVINVFYYVWNVVDAGVTLLDVLSLFKAAVWNFVRAAQTPDVTTNNFVARNLTNGVDIETLNEGTVGLDATGGDVTPSYTAIGFTLNVGTLLTRPGSKRIAGPGEQRVNDNDYDGGGTVSDDIEDKFAATLPVTGASVGEGDAIPHIVGRDILGALDLNRIQPILTVSVSPTIRTQTSRRE